MILGETEGVFNEDGQQPERSTNLLLDSLVGRLMQEANDPPRRPNGMPEAFFDGKQCFFVAGF